MILWDTDGPIDYEPAVMAVIVVVAFIVGYMVGYGW